MSSGNDGKTDLEQTGLSVDERDPDLRSSWSSEKFEEDEVLKEITNEFHMPHVALRASLWNKNPEFAKK